MPGDQSDLKKLLDENPDLKKEIDERTKDTKAVLGAVSNWTRSVQPSDVKPVKM